jgi:uncharacterized protein YkwD
MGILALFLVLPEQANRMARELGERVSMVRQILPNSISPAEEEIDQDAGVPITPIDTKAPEQKPATSSKDKTSLTTENIIEATNAERIKAGLTPLKANTLLTASAKLKTDDMIKRQYFEHVSPSGEGVSDLGRKVGYDYILMGENLALGNFGSAKELVDAWMNSPGHRANILNTGYQEIGIYAAKGTYEGRTVWFSVQHFGTARGACPAINEKLKASIDTANARLRAQEEQIEDMRATLESPNRPTGSEYEKLVTEFNALVAKYNADLAATQKNISTYNAQVKTFNACLAMYQK